MSANKYLSDIIDKYDNNRVYNSNEKRVFRELSEIIKEYFNSQINCARVAHYAPQIETLWSGSRAKGTAIKGSSDMDIFVSITDRENNDTLKNYYDEIYKFLKSKVGEARRQNVSIGIKYAGYSVDITPAKRSNQEPYSLYSDEYWIWSNKGESRTKTNIQKHIDLVKSSKIEKYVMLMKIWRNNHGLDIPSIYIELVVHDALCAKRTNDLATDFYHLLCYFRDKIENTKVVDPGNCQNIISDILSRNEKVKIKRRLELSLEKKSWSQIVW